MLPDRACGGLMDDGVFFARVALLFSTRPLIQGRGLKYSYIHR